MTNTTRISGTGFLAEATVMVDIMAVRVTVVNSTTITAIALARAAGPVDVVVTNPGGSGGTLPAAFTLLLREDGWWGNRNGATAGTHMVAAPTRPGQYEFRYLLEGGFLEAARSRPVMVR